MSKLTTTCILLALIGEIAPILNAPTNFIHIIWPFYDFRNIILITFCAAGCIRAQFTHPAPWELARRGRSKRISCTVDDSVTLSSTPIHWYRAQPGQALQRILYFGAGASTPTTDPEFSRKFNGGKKERTFSLTSTGVNDGDAATYYCALWRGDTVIDYPLRAMQKPSASFL